MDNLFKLQATMEEKVAQLEELAKRQGLLTAPGTSQEDELNNGGMCCLPLILLFLLLMF